MGFPIQRKHDNSAVLRGWL